MPEMATWPGLITNADPHDLPPGAAVVQNNDFSHREGELRVRKGLGVVEFDDPGSGSVVDSQVLCIAAMNHPHAAYIVYLNANGQVRIAKNPQ